MVGISFAQLPQEPEAGLVPGTGQGLEADREHGRALREQRLAASEQVEYFRFGSEIVPISFGDNCVNR